jgi:hypothetical protein
MFVVGSCYLVLLLCIVCIVETNNKLNYLDITINNKHNTLTFNIYRKPTTTDLIIHNDSCHTPNTKQPQSDT